jgi:Domain of unknown function (DUF4062)
LHKDDLEVFVSSNQKEFSRKRKRLEMMINSMYYLTCRLLENRGADADNPRTRSLRAVRDSDLYIGLFGKRYSQITQEECKTALDNNKRCLIYVMDMKAELRDHRVSEFIEMELKHRISYHKFRSCKPLIEQIERDLKAQMISILRTGLGVMTQIKEDVKNKEREFSAKIYSSSSPSNKNNVSSLLEIAKLDYNNGNYLAALTNISVYIELLLRRNLTESKKEDYSKVPFHVLLRESLTSNLSPNMVTKLKVFWNIRNKAIHYGSVPSKNDIKMLLELAKIIEQTFLLRLESSPILTERDRRIIATRFMQRICEIDLDAISWGRSREFAIDQIWDDYLGAYNKEIVAPFVIFYFDNELGYIHELPNKKISITSKGKEHCKDEFVLPAGL